MLQQFLLWSGLALQFSGLDCGTLEPAFLWGMDSKEISAGYQEVEPEQVLTLQFVASTKEGRELASTIKRGLPYRILLGDDQPSYLQLAVFGMQVGGEREVTLDPDYAFGTMGAAPIVGPNTTLVLRVKILRADPLEKKGGL
jgi:FKBP-type peptidyl-prolyl cis-trans isomerase